MNISMVLNEEQIKEAIKYYIEEKRGFVIMSDIKVNFDKIDENMYATLEIKSK